MSKDSKQMGLFSAILLGVAGMMGSGWLFAPYLAAKISGPASILAWIIGAAIVILLGLCFAEIASLYPRRGLSAIVPTISHNRYFGFPFAISNWLGIIAVIALEADATIQYLVNLVPHIAPYIFNHGVLTNIGELLAGMLVILYTLGNYWGAQVMAKTNNIFTVLKVLVPIVVALSILGTQFHASNFTLIGQTWLPYGANSIAATILATGIIVAFNGFQSVVSFASEIKRPSRTIPLSIFIAVIFCLLIYILLEVSFIGGLPINLLHQGWHHVSFTAPMVELPALLGLTFLTSIIYFGATLAPSGTALAFMGTSTRLFTAMARGKQMPTYFDDVHPIHRISRKSLLLNAGIAMLLLYLFRSWSELAILLSILHVISYLPVPIALWVFRDSMNTNRYPFKLWGGHAIALILFIIFTYLFALAPLQAISRILIIFFIFQIIFIGLNVKSIPELWHAIRQCAMAYAYLGGVWMLAHFSPENNHAMNEYGFLFMTLTFSIGLFFALIRYERNDASIIQSSVHVYRQSRDMS